MSETVIAYKGFDKDLGGIPRRYFDLLCILG